MGGVCLCSSCTCRPAWPVVLLLLAAPCVLSSAAAAGKMYPRGNHWAVGHLMGKKSLPELQETNRDSDYLTPSETARVTAPDRYQHLMEALMQPKNQKQMMPGTSDRLLQLHSSSRSEEDRDGYLREMSHLLLLALKLQENDSA